MRFEFWDFDDINQAEWTSPRLVRAPVGANWCDIFRFFRCWCGPSFFLIFVVLVRCGPSFWSIIIGYSIIKISTLKLDIWKFSFGSKRESINLNPKNRYFQFKGWDLLNLSGCQNCTLKYPVLGLRFIGSLLVPELYLKISVFRVEISGTLWVPKLYFQISIFRVEIYWIPLGA